VSLDHSLGREEGFDLFAQDGDAVGLLDSEIRIADGKSRRQGDELTLIHSGRLAPNPRH
jgi:hypothetical protein